MAFADALTGRPHGLLNVAGQESLLGRGDPGEIGIGGELADALEIPIGQIRLFHL